MASRRRVGDAVTFKSSAAAADIRERGLTRSGTRMAPSLVQHR